jgi:SAM-dependent methyltransferase
VLDERFWDEYTLRQPQTAQADHLRVLLEPWLSEIESVLEIGCNRGDNLAAFDCQAWGVEPNETARRQAWERGYPVWDATAASLPFKPKTFDLVFTMGVLIHIPSAELDKSLRGIHRVSRRYILAVEYGAAVVEARDYRGVRAGIWKRPYDHEYLSRFGDLALVGSGEAPELDGCHWWLLEKK